MKNQEEIKEIWREINGKEWFRCEWCGKWFEYKGEKTKCINGYEIVNHITDIMKLVCDKCWEIKHTKDIAKIMSMTDFTSLEESGLKLERISKDDFMDM